MKNVIRVGDPSSHGGVVESGASNFMVEGRPVARVGDTCVCPMEGHQVCVVAEGEPTFVIESRAVAFDGHKSSCDATLHAAAGNFGGS